MAGRGGDPGTCCLSKRALLRLCLRSTQTILEGGGRTKKQPRESQASREEAEFRIHPWAKKGVPFVLCDRGGGERLDGESRLKGEGEVRRCLSKQRAERHLWALPGTSEGTGAQAASARHLGGGGEESLRPPPLAHPGPERAVEGARGLLDGRLLSPPSTPYPCKFQRDKLLIKSPEEQPRFFLSSFLFSPFLDLHGPQLRSGQPNRPAVPPSFQYPKENANRGGAQPTRVSPHLSLPLPLFFKRQSEISNIF